MKFIIYNPISGGKGKSNLAKVERELEKYEQIRVFKTEYTGHASKLAQLAIQEQAERIIAIGGDGTINEVARELIHSSIPMGIVPMGSGNGLARHLGLSLSLPESLKFAIQSETWKAIDVAYFNDRPFFCTAGVGFDAAVANKFAQSKGRGFLNYIKSTFLVNQTYKPIQLRFSGEKSFRPLFSLTIANANQFGNQAYISPGSNIMDNQIELVMIEPLQFLEKIQLGISLFSKSIEKHPKVSIKQVESIEFEALNCPYYHIDGETFLLNQKIIKVRINHQSLKIYF